jgi:hypothetical protein
MSKRERIEDLGRICQMLDVLTKDELFDWKDKISVNCRNKDTAHYFLELDKDKQSDIIHSLAYQISDMHDKLYDMYQIARWGDEELDG